MAMDIWKVREIDRKERNAVLKSGWDEDIKRWIAERDDAKKDHHKPRWSKPKMPVMEKALRKPMVVDFNEGDLGSDEEDEEEQFERMSGEIDSD
jgi:hypothetical protein